MITCFSVGGYRSIAHPQCFDDLAKINVFIGSNNCGKSNILRYVAHHHVQSLGMSSHTLVELDAHKRADSDGRKIEYPFTYGVRLPQGVMEYSKLFDLLSRNDNARSLDLSNHKELLQALAKWFSEKAKKDSSKYAWVEFNSSGEIIFEGWGFHGAHAWDQHLIQIIEFLVAKPIEINDPRFRNSMSSFFRCLVEVGTPLAHQPVFIPAVRNLGGTGNQDKYSGYEIAKALRKLERPDHTNYAVDRNKFKNIVKFLSNVTGDNTAELQISAESEQILVTLDGQLLPIESLGSGIHEVVILAAACTVHEDTVICLEEPESHLNPTLQKKLIQYLDEFTSNQYFISTHSASVIDRPKTNVYEVNLVNGASQVRQLLSDSQHASICRNLGYRPSDLVQANCIIWVEGPSDRMYIAHWIAQASPMLTEGIDYSIMFYGGRLASHLSGENVDSPTVDDFISLRRLNQRCAILIDSDKSKCNDPINTTKTRLLHEFSKDNSFAWLTAGREIENYLDFNLIMEGALAIHPKSNHTGSSGRWEKTLILNTKSNKSASIDKVKLSSWLTSKYTLSIDILDLDERISKLCSFITESN